jgi:RNA polymerase sigma factor (TIGR02999 family)
VEADLGSLASLIAEAERGDVRATDALFSRLYSELHRLAKRELSKQGAPPSLGVTTLLHEAYIEMAAREGISFPDRARFMGYASRVMRGLIIDHVRSRRALKRGGRFEITALTTEVAGEMVDERELSQIGQALDRLAGEDRALAEVVDLKYFCGFTFAELAALYGVTERTVQRRWEKARIYLYRALSTKLGPGAG